MKITDVICSGRDIRGVFSQALGQVETDKAYVVKIKEGSNRTLQQNRRMWAMLGDISRQVRWHDQKLSDKDWKHVFTAAIKGQKLIPGLDGQLVVLGVSTSSESVKFIGDVIEMMFAFGAEQNVFWSDPAEKALMEYPEARKNEKYTAG